MKPPREPDRAPPKLRHPAATAVVTVLALALCVTAILVCAGA